ncbi:helix-turn-helix domain-containing protein [Streptomyces sp. NPDC003509]
MPDKDPMFLRKKLSAALHSARARSGYSQLEVAEAMVWSLSKVMRVETGKVKISVTDLRALIDYYDISETEASELIQMAQQARRLPWWHEYRGLLSEGFQSYLGYEASALTIRNFEVTLIPGLLQTEEYARVVLQKSVVPQKEELLELRMRRQERLMETPSEVGLFFIIDESAMRRVVGSEAVMKAQHSRLMEFNELPHVSVRIVPFSSGMYPLLRSPYVIFDFPDPAQDRVVYLENPDGSVVIRDKATLGIHRTTEDYLEAFWEVENRFSAPVGSAHDFFG